MNEITVRSSFVGLLAHPVGHSVSPAMHNAAFAALRLDWRYLAFEVVPERLPQALRGAGALGFKGLNLTIPHKEAALLEMARVEPAARRIGAINTVCFEEEGPVGHNTDKEGFLGSLAGAGYSPRGKRALVFGCGGAARAVVVGLAEEGAEEILLVARNPKKAERVVSAAREMGIKSGLIPWEGELRRVVEEAELVVNATPLGMAPDSGQSPVAGEWLRPDQFVYDLVFNPDPSRLVREARGRGCRALGGLEMLVRQGALSFRLWTGVEPPLEVMAAAARAGLEGNVGGR